MRVWWTLKEIGVRYIIRINYGKTLVYILDNRYNNYYAI